MAHHPSLLQRENIPSGKLLQRRATGRDILKLDHAFDLSYQPHPGITITAGNSFSLP
jgi:hypothetical protein